MLIRIFLPWIVLAGVVGFALGASLFSEPSNCFRYGKAEMASHSDETTVAVSGADHNCRAWWGPEWALVWITIALATITAALALYTARLWSATQKLVVGADDTAARQLRAYVGVLAGAIEHQQSSSGHALSIRVELRNSGRTPAYGFRTWIAVLIDKPDARPFWFPRDLNDRPPTVLIPDANTNIDIGFPAPLNAVQAVHDGSMRIFVWGRAEYVDAFNQPRFLTFKMHNGGYTPGNNRWHVSPHEEYEAN